MTADHPHMATPQLRYLHSAVVAAEQGLDVCQAHLDYCARAGETEWTAKSRRTRDNAAASLASQQRQLANAERAAAA